MLRNLIQPNDLVLYDIDGTILSSVGAGIKALKSAFKEVVNEDPDMPSKKVSGKTDLQIIYEVFREFQITEDEVLANKVLNTYLDNLDTSLKNSEVVTYPGIRESIDYLNQLDVQIGLLTGNVERGAFIKLGAVNLESKFEVGAYGSDDINRNKLVPIALEKFQAIGKNFHAERTWVIGDTPRDIECAQVHGAKCIAVATGAYSKEVLEEYKAEVTVNSLEELL